MKKSILLVAVLMALVSLCLVFASCDSGSSDSSDNVPVTCTVSFAAGEGTGSMEPVTVEKGTSYQVPACAFTAPSGKVFKCWNDGTADINVGESIVVGSDITLTAQWQDEPGDGPTPPSAPVAVESVSLNLTKLTLAVGETETLTATVEPDTATNKSVTWESDKTAIATVENGTVTAVSVGTATITVKTVDGDKTATCEVTVTPAGVLSGLFSVSGTKQVHFSQGNLQATIDESGVPTAWKFAEKQYDCLGKGEANETIGSAAGDIDLFGWSTDGVGANAYYKEWGINTVDIDVSSPGGDYKEYFGGFKDWGSIESLPGNSSTTKVWRTLLKDEWSYLFNTRTVNGNTGEGYSYSLNITYGGKMGVVLYPDDYTGSVLSDSVTNLPEGVVFLPAAGIRYGSGVNSVDSMGYYWSATPHESDVYGAYSLYFTDGVVEPAYGNVTRDKGCSVRLVCDEN